MTRTATFRRSNTPWYYDGNTSPHHAYDQRYFAIWYSEKWSQWVFCATDDFGNHAAACWRSDTLNGVYDPHNGATGQVSLGEPREVRTTVDVWGRYSSRRIREYMWPDEFVLQSEDWKTVLTKQSLALYPTVYTFGPVITQRYGGPYYWYSTQHANIQPRSGSQLAGEWELSVDVSWMSPGDNTIEAVLMYSDYTGGDQNRWYAIGWIIVCGPRAGDFVYTPIAVRAATTGLDAIRNRYVGTATQYIDQRATVYDDL